MSKEKGNLSIHSENIFPIIKKWLYSDHDIFIRELVSNACDAITKVKRLNALGEADLKENTDFNIHIIFDKNARTLKFIDNGIGMTADEIKQYINQIAFSGAEDFIEKYKDKGDQDQIIGHFGLGFYSSFMVANTVEINTLSYKDGAESALWRCEGGTEFELEDGTKKSRGTEITLYLGDDGEDFMNPAKIKSTIEKYCSFMPFPVYFKDLSEEPKKDKDGKVIIEEPKSINDTTPLYTKKPNESTDEEYKDFYRKTFNDFKEPLFWIHLNMDYPFNLKGILYFPKLGTDFDTMEGQIKLYNSQVFVADNIKEVIPEFMLLLKGVIDCPDLPLNVSRSFLQNDGFVKKISDYITKKIADKLNGLFKADRENYETFWDDISPFVKYGSIRDEKFFERVQENILYKTTDNKYQTVEEYLESHEGKLENKVFYSTDEVQQAQYIKMIKEHDIEAVVLDHSIDSAFISHLEQKKSEIKFNRVDSDLTDIIKEIDENHNEEEHTTLTESITNMFKKALSNENLKVQLETLKSKDVSAMIVLSEDSRRMQDMMKMYKMAGMDPSMFPSEETLVLNKKHPLIQYVLDETKVEMDLKETIAKHIYDLAMISHKPLTPEAMTEFIKRSNEIMEKMI